jgi:hypothetical protein
MGDRCYVSVSVWHEDREAMIDILGEPEYVEDQGACIQLGYESYNHAAYDELERAGKKRLRFNGYHTEGDNYGRYAFVCCDTTQLIPRGVMYVPEHEEIGDCVSVSCRDGVVIIDQRSLARYQIYAEVMHDFEVLCRAYDLAEENKQ